MKVLLMGGCFSQKCHVLCINVIKDMIWCIFLIICIELICITSTYCAKEVYIVDCIKKKKKSTM